MGTEPRSEMPVVFVGDQDSQLLFRLVALSCVWMRADFIHTLVWTTGKQFVGDDATAKEMGTWLTTSSL